MSSQYTGATSIYQRGQPIWIWRAKSWRPGKIVSASTHAALVTYQPGAHAGQATDTVHLIMLRERTNTEPPTSPPRGFA